MRTLRALWFCLRGDDVLTAVLAVLTMVASWIMLAML